MNDNKELIAENKSLEDLEGEQWVAVRNSKHYFVSNLGRVRSNNKHAMKVLEQQKNNSGYWRVCLSLEVGVPKYYLVSRIVAEAFSPEEAEESNQVHHTKGKDCNSADSLVWLTKEKHDQEHQRLRKKQKAKGNGEE